MATTYQNMPLMKVNLASYFDMRYFRVQTNRASIKKLLTSFQSCIEIDEHLVSPRPLPGEVFAFYFALACVKHDGKNIGIVKKFKHCKEITIQDYEDEKASIKFAWSSKAKIAQQIFKVVGLWV